MATNTYRFDCKTIADVPSRNRKWYTIATGRSPEEAFAKVQAYRPGEKIEILATWLHISGQVPGIKVTR